MIKTEMRNENTKNIDSVTSIEMLEMMNKENFNAVKAVGEAIDTIAKAVDIISERLNKGGRLIYIGAGTSGRLGIIDAAECPPTFGVSKETVIGIIAGGYNCLVNASENAEDDEESGIKDVSAINISDKDALVGISAAGNAKYVYGALKKAKDTGAVTFALTCNNEGLITKIADVSIITDTGAEVITGSTRLKAGTAHKLVLNMLSTGVMIKTGKVYENFMINVKPVNIKLRKRCISIISQITGVCESEAEKYLDKANGDIKNAIKLIGEI